MAKTRRRSRAATSQARQKPAASEGGLTNTEKRERLVRALERHLREDPLFQVTTVDGLHWIDPHTGTLVEAPFDRDRIVMDWLLEHRPWRTHKLKPLKLVRVLRWRHYLANRLEEDPHLRVFSAEGVWLNPFTGMWEEDIRLPADGRISSGFLNTMAHRLVDYTEGSLQQTLPIAQLQHLLQTRRRDEAARGRPRHDSEPELSLSASHQVVQAWDSDQDGSEHPSYAINDDLDSPDLDFLQNLDIRTDVGVGSSSAQRRATAPATGSGTQRPATAPATGSSAQRPATAPADEQRPPVARTAKPIPTARP
ncbi:MAG: hypothetical protein ACOCXJ_09830, partial [Planctomycetota bacterium]